MKGSIMKTMAIFSLLLAFAAAPVFAGSCGGGCDKDKDVSAFGMNYQLLCGGGCDKDKPAPAPELFCGGDKGDKPAPAPELFCGGGCGKDKEDIKA